MAHTYREPAGPYPGLRQFESYEAEIFFGREEHTDRLLEILKARRFLAVIGPSGSGKSSLVRAGMLPALAMGSLGSGSQWRVAVMRPGGRPLESLAAALLAPEVLGPELGAGEAAPDARDEVLVATLAAELRRGPLGLLHVVRSALESPDAAKVNLLILVDQFEELFTYAEAAEPRDDESLAFVQLLLHACRDEGARIHVALTMRTDFLGHCVRYVELPDAINRGQYLTPRLTRAQMELAIVGPAQVFGGDVDVTLATELINATGQNSDQLPLVQHALACMWPLAVARDAGSPSIAWADAKAVGGVEGALGQHAESLLSQATATLPPEHAHLPEAIFRRITTRHGGNQDVRSPCSVARIARACGLGPEQWQSVARVVEIFAAPGASLLQHGPRLQPDSVVDISHEALIRQWQRLREWVADEARRAAEYRRWAERAGDHAQHQGSLLDGADLARAVDWWNPEPQTTGRGWQPTAPWAERYAANTAGADAQAEFDRTVAFISTSREVRAQEQAEREHSLAQAQLVKTERAHARETERLLKRTRRALSGSVVLFVVALLAGGWAVIASRDAARQTMALAEESQRVAAATAAAKASEAEASLARATQAAEFEAATARQERMARAESEKLRIKAETAEKRARQLAEEATKQAQATRDALDELKRQQAVAEEQRRIAEEQTSLAANTQDRLRTQGTQVVLNSIYDSAMIEDGIYGPRTAAGVRTLQAEVGLPESGTLDNATWACVQRLLNVPAAERKAAAVPGCGAPAKASQTTLELQRFLNDRGFSVPKDGSFGRVTQAVLKLFQSVVGLRESGALDAGTAECIAQVRNLPADRKLDDLKDACVR